MRGQDQPPAPLADATACRFAVIVSRFNDALGSTMKSVLDLPSQYQEIGAAVRAGVMDDFQNLGLQVKQFFITSITPPESTARR